MIDKWWLNLRSGDKVYTVGDRRKNSGVATVLQNGKKYIHIAHEARALRVNKSSGRLEDYPKTLIYRSEKHHMVAVDARRQFAGMLQQLSDLHRDDSFIPTEEQLQALNLYLESLR